LEKALGLEKPVTRVFIDANILFSAALYPESRIAALVAHSKAMGLQCLCSPAVVEEALRNLKKKHPASLQRIPKLLALVEVVHGFSSKPCPIKLPEKDQHVMLAAMAGNADILLTGDIKDFGPYMNKPKLTQGMIIQTFSQLIDALSKEKDR
jgi:uncharacterized protein